MSWSAIVAGGAAVAGSLIDANEQRGTRQVLQQGSSFQDSFFNAPGLTGNQALGRSNVRFDDQGQALQDQFGAAAQGFFQGPQFAQGANQGLSNINFNQLFGGALGTFGQQVGSSPFGSLGGLNQATGVGGLGGAFSAGGLGQLAAGNATIGQAGNAAGIRQEALGALRQQAGGGLLDQAINKFQDRQFGQGRQGSTGGALEQETFLNSLAQQDLGFQTQAFGIGQEQQNFLGQLGLGQLGAGAAQGGLGANLLGLSGGFEGQQFGQNLQSQGLAQQGAQQGLSGINQFLGTAGGIAGQFGQLGLQGLGGQLEQQSQLQNFLVNMRNAEANRIGGFGQSASGLAGQKSSGIGDMIAGVGSGIGGFMSGSSFGG